MIDEFVGGGKGGIVTLLAGSASNELLSGAGVILEEMSRGGGARESVCWGGPNVGRKQMASVHFSASVSSD